MTKEARIANAKRAVKAGAFDLTKADLASLRPAERVVLQELYGVGTPQRPRDDIAKDLNITREWTRHLENTALLTLIEGVRP